MTSRRRSGRSATQKIQSYSSNEEEEDEAQEEEEEDPLSDLTRPQLLQINRSFDSVASKVIDRASLDTSRSPFPDILEESNSRSTFQSGTEDFAPGGFISGDQAEGEDQYDGGGFIAMDEDEGGGGFIADDEPAQQGGFVTEDREGSVHKETPNPQSVSRDAIPVESIPEALKILGLPYKDSDILQVFEQAASSDEDESGSRRQWVRRRQFTRVCAALMADPGSVTGDQDGGEEVASGSDVSFVASTSRNKRRKNGKSKSTSKSDHNSTDDESFIPPSESEARTTGTARSKPTRGSRAKKGEDIDNRNVLETFQLFFPESDKKDRTAITFPDIRRITEELGEKMTDDEIQEMLEYASGTKDSCVDLPAFERVLMDIKAV
ncbi:uncharacterized protein MELLADRAFT_117959 [Melampsora larici-populina 98AG31]|uniref:EF-hand domain-containing protein n=1 Tax=Melampsora larici-populina (strain 98AG31 / pathotype 3-4-7) TaxID=747676 RepID=F4S3H4_MELLP|nr:uncharacterized protein MELLADRAFT_117959 [Melampsora larici-populina 98AG31]EGG00813.1 hypothetical protein MELLADRAFT_117959 [Melampsora larici-populina 98AG31]